MNVKPIIFSAPMVRALLEGRKTQTRRVLKLPTKGEYIRPDMGGWEPTTNGGECVFKVTRNGQRVPTPETVGVWNQTTGTCLDAPFQVGDLLWVREKFNYSSDDELHPSETKNPRPQRAIYSAKNVVYGADGVEDHPEYGRAIWKPSIHMPIWASRITLEVTEVRVQRLQDISEEDAIAEGIEDVTQEVASNDPLLRFWKRYRDGGWNGYVDTAGGSYASLWTEINGPGAWAANPWVAAITFKPHLCNVDEMLKQRGAA